MALNSRASARVEGAMSVELEVRLGSKQVALSDLASLVEHELKARFPRHEAGPMRSWHLPEQFRGILGGEVCVLGLELTDEAEVEVRSYSVGAERDLGEDGGWWVCFSATLRSPATLCLLILAAACLARLSNTLVLDDSLFLRQERWLAPDKLLATIGTSEDLTLEEAAAQLRERGKL